MIISSLTKTHLINKAFIITMSQWTLFTLTSSVRKITLRECLNFARIEEATQLIQMLTET